MSKCIRRSYNHTPVPAQRNNRQALQKSPTSQQHTKEKDYDLSSKSGQSTTYDLVTLFTMMGGFIHWEPFLYV